MFSIEGKPRGLNKCRLAPVDGAGGFLLGGEKRLVDRKEGRDQGNLYREERIGRYRELAERAGYGDRALPEYDPDLWLEDAIHENVRGLRDRSDFTLARWDPLTDVYSWKDSVNYRNTSWHCFQQAVKDHQNAAWEVLSRTNLMGLELPEL